MNIDLSLIIQIIFLALIIYLMYSHIEPKVRVRFFKTYLTYEHLCLEHYLDYKIVLYQKDIEAYHRYEIWRFFEKTKK